MLSPATLTITDVEQPISCEAMTEQLRALGVREGGVLVVHSSFSALRPVEDGPLGLIWALLQAIGHEGTLVMPSMADDDDALFDPLESPCTGMGIIAEVFRHLPEVRRSDSPHAFAALGPQAELITAPHPLEVPHGADSPIGRVHELGGQILLLGVGHDANTALHLAENLAGVRYRLPVHSTILRDGRPQRVDYLEADHCCAMFAQADAWLGAAGLQRRGQVGHAQARLMEARDLVRLAREQLAAAPEIFLHPPGQCADCDRARAHARPE